MGMDGSMGSRATRAERILFWSAAICVLVYSILRAKEVPLIHDEIRTLREYVNNGNLWPPHAAWDAGNHVLVSLITAGVHRLFGDSNVSLRLFSLLMFAVYALGVRGVANWIADARVRISMWTALLCTPFLVEFFALARGYGPAVAFQMVAVVWAARYSMDRTMCSLIIAMLSAAMASYACLNFLPLTCGVFAYAACSCAIGQVPWAQRWPILLLVVVFGGALLWPSLSYAMALSDRGLFYIGGHRGLVEDTAGSLAFWVLGLGGAAWAMFFAVLAMTLIVVGLIPILRGFSIGWSDPGVFIAFILGMELLGRWLLSTIMDMSYPTDRTAIQFVPFTIVLAAIGLDRLVRVQRKAMNGKGWSAWSALVLVIFPVRLIADANLQRTTFWVRELIPVEVLDAVADAEQHIEEPVSIGGPYHLSECWDRWREIRGENSLHFDTDGYPNTWCDLLIVDTLIDTAPAAFRVLRTVPGSDLVVYERRDPLVKRLISDTSIVVTPTKDEFRDIWAPELDSSILNNPLFVRMEAVMRSPERTIPLTLVVDQHRSDGTNVELTGIDLHHLRNRWEGDTLHLLKHVPRSAGEVTDLEVLFFSPRHFSYEAPYIRMRVYGVAE